MAEKLAVVFVGSPDLSASNNGTSQTCSKEVSDRAVSWEARERRWQNAMVFRDCSESTRTGEVGVIGLTGPRKSHCLVHFVSLSSYTANAHIGAVPAEPRRTLDGRKDELIDKLLL